MTEKPIPQLPLFVYGTLRPGASRYGLIREYVEEGGEKSAYIQGFQMYDFSGTFPGIVRVDSYLPVVGSLLYIDPPRWEECITRVDNYESNGFLFDRTDECYAVIDLAGSFTWQELKYRTKKCWVYLIRAEVLRACPHKVIQSNDWMRR